MKFTKQTRMVGGWPMYVSGDYIVRKTDHNRFYDTWTAFYQGAPLGVSTHMKHAKTRCIEHAAKLTSLGSNAS